MTLTRGVQAPNPREDLLLGGGGLEANPIGRELIAKRDVADALALALLQVQGVPRPLADGFALPLRDRGHDVQHQPPRGGLRVE